MKYLLITTLTLNRSKGGGGNYCYNIFKRFPKGEVTVFTKKTKDTELGGNDLNLNFIKRLYIDPLKPTKTPKLNLIKTMILWFIELFYLCFKNKPRCIYIGDTYPYGLLGLMIKLILVSQNQRHLLIDFVVS